METRRYFKDLYPVTQEEEAILRKVYEPPYLEFRDLPIYSATNTCSHGANDLLLFIENTRNLHTEMENIEKRIAKGLTTSSSIHYDHVEVGLIRKLITTAKEQYEREVGEPVVKVDNNDIYDYFKIPRKRLNFEEAKKYYDKVSPNMVEPERKYEFKLRYNDTQNSTYKLYGVELKSHHMDLRWGNKAKSVYAALKEINVNAGKIYACNGYGSKSNEKYIQIYVYDYIDRDWALNHVVNYLVDNKLIELK